MSLTTRECQVIRRWEAVVKAPQGGPIYTHHFAGTTDDTPSDLLCQIADALDLSDADGVQVSMAVVTTTLELT